MSVVCVDVGCALCVCESLSTLGGVFISREEYIHHYLLFVICS